MPVNTVAENVFGTLGAVCWSCQLIPQAYMSWKTKDTKGLSSYMLLIWFAAGFFLGAYVIVQEFNIPLIVQPQAFMLLCSICWAQCMHYNHGWSVKLSAFACIGSCIAAAGIEVGFYFAAKASDHVRTAWGILASVFIIAGLLPQYYEIWKFKAVIGVSLLFLAVDLFGGIFSFLSLVFRSGQLDPWGSVSYLVVVVLEIGIFILVPILNPRHKRRIEQEKKKEEAEAAAVATLQRRTETETTAVDPSHAADASHGKHAGETPLGWKCQVNAIDEAVEEASRKSSDEHV